MTNAIKGVWNLIWAELEDSSAFSALVSTRGRLKHWLDPTASKAYAEELRTEAIAPAVAVLVNEVTFEPYGTVADSDMRVKYSVVVFGGHDKQLSALDVLWAILAVGSTLGEKLRNYTWNGNPVVSGSEVIGGQLRRDGLPAGWAVALDIGVRFRFRRDALYSEASI